MPSSGQAGNMGNGGALALASTFKSEESLNTTLEYNQMFCLFFLK